MSVCIITFDIYSNKYNYSNKYQLFPADALIFFKAML